MSRIVNPRQHEAPSWSPVLDSVFFYVCLGLLALRVTLSEGPPMSTGISFLTLSDPVLSVSLSLIPMVLLVLWIISSLWRQSGPYRITGMEIGLGLLILGSLIGYSAASDKRAALNDIVITSGPILTTLLLVQLLHSGSRRRLLLAVIVGLGLASTVHGLHQLIKDNPAKIKQYQADPNNLLEPMGIERGSLQQFMLEHRLYSQGMQSFFSTRNSAAVFLLLAVFSSLLIWRDLRSSPRHVLLLLLSGVLLAELVLTRSKGSLISLVLAFAAWLIWSRWSERLRAHRRAIIGAVVVTGIITTIALITYGRTHGRLPGGSSMWVRWQYWSATGQLLHEHPFTGVGPGNFAFAYQQVKPAAAMEAVSDPHNLILSLWVRFGLLGLIGFAAMLLGPWLRLSDHGPSQPSQPKNHDRSFWVACTTVTLALLLFRVALMPPTPQLKASQIFNLYGVPWIMVMLVVWVLRPWIYQQTGRLPGILLFCALSAALFANLAGYGLFEPAVATAFWTLLAVTLVACRRPHNLTCSHWSKFPKALVSLVLLIMMAGVVQYGWIPLSQSTSLIQLAYNRMDQSQPQAALQYLDQATMADPLSPDAWRIKAKLLDAINQHSPNRKTLRQAIAANKQALLRNPADFRIWENTGDEYAKLRQPKQAWQAYTHAKNLYPGLGRLWYKMAQMADDLNRPVDAAQAYAQAVTIEEAFQNQFKQMYPQQKNPVSRLGSDKLTIAKQRLETLKSKPARN